MAAAADLVLTNGAIYALDAPRRWHEALAVRDGRIVAAGRASDVDGLVGRGTYVYDLAGRLVLPGFQDAHVHACSGGLLAMRCDLHATGGREDCLAAIANYTAAHPQAAWLVGGGWSMDHFPGGTPSRADLDAVVPDRPAFLTNRDGHGAWVNGRALAIAGVTGDTVDPPGGRIERDVHGEPSGTLHENAMELVRRWVPEPSPAELERAILVAQGQLHRLGITAWQDASVDERTLAAYLKVARDGALTARVEGNLEWRRDRGEAQIADLLAQRAEARAGRLRLRGVKLFQDGVIENQTAALLEPYLDAGGRPGVDRGLRLFEPETLSRYVTLLDAERFQVHVHAIGDAAVRDALDAFADAVRENGARDSRHHIAHLELVHPDDSPRFASLGVVANVQPLWACPSGYIRDLTLPFVGPERGRRLYPFASLRRAGAMLAFGSDWTVSTPDPLPQIEVATTRAAPGEPVGEQLGVDERLELPEALAAFTIGAAYVNFLERDTGSIEVGKLADLVVLDRNLFSPAAGPPGDARVLLTLVEGKAVFADPDCGWEDGSPSAEPRAGAHRSTSSA